MSAGYQIGVAIGFAMVAAMIGFTTKVITDYERTRRDAAADVVKMQQRIIYEMLMAEARKREAAAQAPVVETTPELEAADKIRRLLSLAQRPGTPAEGRLALAKAHALAEKHGIRIKA